MVRLVDLRPALLALAMLGIGAGALRADPIPQNVLDDNLKSCSQSCTAAGKTPAQCSAYCTCSVDSIEEKFTSAEYSAMNAAIQSKQPIPKGSQDKLQAIVNACNAKTFK
ncbi:MAG TPA: hypothetical protein VHA35_17765 [Dongiaceae bacterium]|nr:hypothetical protein [Dongiaceae bacterium]